MLFGLTYANTAAHQARKTGN